MTLNTFNKLTHQQQLAALELKSVIIGNRKAKKFRVALFQISTFYVEAFYNYHSIKVARLQSFRSLNKLKPYFNNSDIQKP